MHSDFSDYSCEYLKKKKTFKQGEGKAQNLLNICLLLLEITIKMLCYGTSVAFHFWVILALLENFGSILYVEIMPCIL
jgi:hypothetical protein